MQQYDAKWILNYGKAEPIKEMVPNNFIIAMITNITIGVVTVMKWYEDKN